MPGHAWHFINSFYLASLAFKQQHKNMCVGILEVEMPASCCWEFIATNYSIYTCSFLPLVTSGTTEREESVLLLGMAAMGRHTRSSAAWVLGTLP